MAPENIGQEQAGRFRKGQSGNPGGCPKGSRNAATLAVAILLDGQAEALTQKAIQMALAGDSVALRLCLEPCSQRSTGDVPIAAYHECTGRF